MKLADVIVPHHNRHDLLKECLARIDLKRFNVVVCSGGSFAENCNRGARAAITDNLLFLNDDTEPDSDVLEAMLARDFDLVGVDQEIQGIAYYGTALVEGTLEVICNPNVQIPTGVCLRVRRSVFHALNGFDERYRTGFEDTDFGLRALEQGYSIGFIFGRPIKHLWLQSAGRHLHNEANEQYFNEQWPMERVTKALLNARIGLAPYVAANQG